MPGVSFPRGDLNFGKLSPMVGKFECQQLPWMYEIRGRAGIGEFRKQVAEKVGLGFEPPSEKAVIGPNGPKIEVRAVEEFAVIY